MRWMAWRALPGSSFSSTTAVTATLTPSLRRLRRLYSAADGGPPLRGRRLDRPAGKRHPDQRHDRPEQVHRREDLVQHGYGDGHAEDGASSVSTSPFRCPALNDPPASTRTKTPSRARAMPTACRQVIGSARVSQTRDAVITGETAMISTELLAVV